MLTRRMIYTTIAFQLTRKCNAKCKICCESSSSQLRDKLDTDVILKSINAIKNVESIRNIAVTGGEPFLYPDDVLSIARLCKETGRLFTIITNAFWCVSYSHALSVLSQLKENNLASCVVSADASHQEYIPIEYVKFFLRACSDLRIPTKIQTNSIKSTFSRTDEIINSIGKDKMHIQVLFASVYPVGRAKEHFGQEEFFTRKLDRAVCQYQHILHISSDGRVEPCCSPCYIDIPFDFGNIYTDSLEDVLNKVSDNELMRVISSEGFIRLLNEAKLELGFNELNEYVDACHLCNHLLADADRYAHFLEKAKIWRLQENEVISAIRDSQRQMLESM